MSTPGQMACAVCGGAVQESNSGLCDGCDQRFHLNLRNDMDGKDCGDVWIDEQYLSLRFACFNCLPGRPAPAGQGEPPVGEAH